MAEISETTIKFEKNEYNLVKTGRQQAEQIIRLSGWLSKYGSLVFDKINMEEGGRSPSTYELIVSVLGVLDVDALIEGFVLVTGCNKKEADAEFDIDTLIGAGLVIVNENSSFSKVISRFFSGSRS